MKRFLPGISSVLPPSNRQATSPGAPCGGAQPETSLQPSHVSGAVIARKENRGICWLLSGTATGTASLGTVSEHDLPHTHMAPQKHKLLFLFGSSWKGSVRHTVITFLSTKDAKRETGKQNAPSAQDAPL